MSDGAAVQITSLEEVTWNVTPGSAMAIVAGANSASDGLTAQTVKTAALRSDYIKEDTIRVQNMGGLTIPFELRWGDIPFLNWLEGVLRNDWTAAQTVTATDISFTNADNSINSVAEDLTVFPVGSWVRVDGTVSNDGLHQVTVSTTTKLTISSLTTIVDEIAGSSFTLDNDGYLRNGSTLKSFTLERNFTDLSSTPFLAQAGQRPNGMTLEMPHGNLITGSVSFEGVKPLAPAAATVGTGAATAASTTKTMSGSQDISAHFEGGVAMAAQVSQMSLNLSAPVRADFSQQNGLDPFRIGGNSFEFSGSAQVYNSDTGLAFWLKFRNDTATSLYYKLTDSAGNIYQFSMPRIKLTAGNPDVTDVESAVYLPMDFNIDYDSTLGFLFQVDRFAA